MTEQRGWVPHVTLRYADPEKANPPQLQAPVEMPVHGVSLVVGGRRIDFPLNASKDIGAASPGITSDSPVGGNPQGFRPIQRGNVVLQPQRDPLVGSRRRRRPKETDEEPTEGKAGAPAAGRKSALGITFSPLNRSRPR